MSKDTSLAVVVNDGVYTFDVKEVLYIHDRGMKVQIPIVVDNENLDGTEFKTHQMTADEFLKAVSYSSTDIPITHSMLRKIKSSGKDDVRVFVAGLTGAGTILPNSINFNYHTLMYKTESTNEVLQIPIRRDPINMQLRRFIKIGDLAYFELLIKEINASQQLEGKNKGLKAIQMLFRHKFNTRDTACNTGKEKV